MEGGGWRDGWCEESGGMGGEEGGVRRVEGLRVR